MCIVNGVEYKDKYISQKFAKKDNFEYIDKEKINKFIESNEYRLHPLLPIIVRFDGREIYDIRDGFKIILKYINGNKKDRPLCRVSGFVRYFIHRLTAESWMGRLVCENEDVHHKDLDRYNNHYSNLIILDKNYHIMLHRKLNKLKNIKKLT